MIKFYRKHSLKILILLWIISGIIVVPEFIPGIKIDQKLQKYYDDYMGMVKSNCPTSDYNNPSKIIIEFDDLSGGEIGYCVERLFSYKISVDRMYWNAVGETERTQLMFHELSHCVIYKDHVNDMENYMFPILEPLSPVDLRKQVLKDIKDFCQ